MRRDETDCGELGCRDIEGKRGSSKNGVNNAEDGEGEGTE
jgi:hypothetical protein